MEPRILLVEDDPGLRLTLTDRLHREGYAVSTACDGEDGLAQARRETFALVILDVMLPRRSGFDVCRALRKEGVRTSVLMLSARGQVEDRVAGFELGADVLEDAAPDTLQAQVTHVPSPRQRSSQ